MPRVRWVKGLDELKQAREGRKPLSSTVRSIRTHYETDPAVARAVLPRPLEPAARPEVQLTVSQVSIHVSPEITFEIGSAIFGVAARYDGTEGLYLLTMAMTSEPAVVGGRETYGEPKKIADIRCNLGDAARGAQLGATVTRMGIPYIELRGSVGADLGPRDFTEHAFCFKAMPSCEPDKALDADPLLVRLEWAHRQTRTARIDGGEIILRDSPFDPVADLPVRRLLRMEYAEGTTGSCGRVLRSIPGEWLLPFLHGRYDEPGVRGIEA